jgi:hypothetical protein
MIKIVVYYKIWVDIVLKKFKVKAYITLYKKFKMSRIFKIDIFYYSEVRLELETSEHKLTM